MVNIDYIELVLKDPLSSKTKLSVHCAEDFHFVGAIYLDGKLLCNSQSTELEFILSELNDYCKQIMGD